MIYVSFRNNRVTSLLFLFRTFTELLTFSKMFSLLTLKRIRGGRGIPRRRTNTLGDLGRVLRQERSQPGGQAGAGEGGGSFQVRG